MRRIISFIMIATFLSCEQNDTKQTDSEVKQLESGLKEKALEPKQKDSTALKITLVDTPKITSTITPLAKEQLWKEYWTKFSAAVNKKDKKSMIDLSLQTGEFFDGGGGGTAAQWINSADHETWRYWQKAITKGTKIFEKTQRITKNDYMIFDFKDGKWVWSGVMGD